MLLILSIKVVTLTKLEMESMSKSQLVRFTLSICFVGASALANGLRNPPEGAAALGRQGGNFVFGDDGSAMSYNPANLSELDRVSLYNSLTLALVESDFTGPGGRKGSTRDNDKWLPNVFAVYPLPEKDIVLGLGISTPYGQSTKWEPDGPFTFAFPHSAEIKLININPTIAGKINDRLSYGVGLDVFWSELSFDQMFPWSMVTGSPLSPPGLAETKGDGVGIGGNIGLLYQIDERQRVGLTYRSSVDVDYEGDFDLSNVPGPLSGLVAPASDFDSSIEFPNRVGLGYGIALNDRLKIGIDVEWIEFSSFDQLPVDLGVNNASGLFPPSIPQNWDDIVDIFVGGDYQLDESLTLRAGYAFLESPVPDSTLSPTIPDADRHVLSVGLGYTKENIRIDVAYGIGIYDDINITNNQNPAANGKYDISSHLISTSLNYSF
jgi:long-chain fatty acid transport protein